jgi:hypothetical protein
VKIHGESINRERVVIEIEDGVLVKGAPFFCVPRRLDIRVIFAWGIWEYFIC